MGQGAQAVTYMDAQDNPVYEPHARRKQAVGRDPGDRAFVSETESGPHHRLLPAHFGKQMPYKVEQARRQRIGRA
jgi:ribosomal protein L11 methyltransferase